MALYTQPVQSLIDELGRLPGVGPKSAQRIAFHLLKLPGEDVARLALAITDAKARVRFCSRCWNVADGELCPICLDDRRDASLAAVAYGVAHGCRIVRVHDVAGSVKVCRTVEAILRARQGENCAAGSDA